MLQQPAPKPQPADLKRRLGSAFPRPWRAVLILAIFISACGWQSLDIFGPPAPLSMFTDIPLPPELKLDEENSRVFEHEFGRVGLMKTKGRLSHSEAMNYYRTVMAQNGWIKDSEFDNGISQMLIFSKDPRSAAITITEGWVTTEVEINVSAKIQQ